jgi:hypothetical protein
VCSTASTHRGEERKKDKEEEEERALCIAFTMINEDIHNKTRLLFS